MWRLAVNGTFSAGTSISGALVRRMVRVRLNDFLDQEAIDEQEPGRAGHVLSASRGGGLVVLPGWEHEVPGLVWRDARPTGLPSTPADRDWDRRGARVLRRDRDHVGPFDQARRLHPIGRNGGRVLAVSRAQGRLAHSQPRR